MLSSMTALAQKYWTLEECIKYAYENNIQIKQSNIAQKQNENELQRSKMDYLPSFNASVSQNLNWGRSVDLNDLQIIENKLFQSTSANLGASIYLLEGLSKINTVKSSAKSLEISIQDTERLKDELSINIARAYLQILLSQEMYEVSQQNFESIYEQKERTKLHVEAGSQAYSALLDIEAQLARERLQLITNKNQVKINITNLAQILDISSVNDFMIVTPDLDKSLNSIVFNDIDSIYHASLNLPRIKRNELMLDKSKIDLKIAKGKVYPSISMSASYGAFYNSSNHDQFFTQFQNNASTSVGFTLSIPIFNNLQIKTSIRNARLNVENTELELQYNKQTLFKEIQTALTDAEAFFEKMSAAEVNLNAIKESFKYVEEKFNLGVLTGTDYTVAKTNVLVAQSEYYQAKYQYIFQLTIIDFYKGKTITL